MFNVLHRFFGGAGVLSADRYVADVADVFDALLNQSSVIRLLGFMGKPMESGKHSLIYRVVKQGGIFIRSCDELHDAIKDRRAVATQRIKLLNAKTKMLVLSQNCDITNRKNRYLELVTLKLKPSPSITVQHVRSYDKLQIPFDGQYYGYQSELIR